MSKTREIIAHSTRVLCNSAFAISVALWVAASVPHASAAGTARLEVTIALASHSARAAPPGFDKRLLFAKSGLMRTGYRTFTYVRRYPLRVAEGKATRLSLGGKISVVLGFKGFIGPQGRRIQYYLETYSGKKRQARIYYSISKGGAPAITGIDQPGGQRAYVLIVRAPK